MNRKAAGTVLGFLLFALGIVSVLLNMNGLQLSFLSFLSSLSQLQLLIVHLVMILGGAILMYLSLVNWKNYQ